MKRRAAARIPAEGAGKTLLEYLSSRFNYHSSDEWQKHILAGELALDNVVCQQPGRVLSVGMLLEYDPKELQEPAVNQDYRIIFEDEFLLVIDKPGNLPVHPAGPYFNHTLWALLNDAGYGKIHFVNRLDRETSGLLIAAKDSRTAGEINKTLPEMLKRYMVLVHGIFPEEAVIAEGFLLADTDSSIRKKQRFVPLSAVPEILPEKSAAVKTLFRRLQGNEKYTLLAAELFTGRMHQIRATLRGLNFPVVGDKLYGLDEQFYRKLALDTLSAADRERLVLARQALHCSDLGFVHPASGKKLEFHAPLPEELKAVIEF